ncbi:nodulin MtN21 /EamA-like transporter family protein [Actinidia rufa]|uniref:Nodulin MtN21 /EamA-like transporter family protein n=1 Tax=Actinidia rufa TaxID=165716 RepID=A0A7J0ELB0_9ERIC|nr:nodulin MtN21 /EamA-like transporter family protein [Actinidia rufa]
MFVSNFYRGSGLPPLKISTFLKICPTWTLRVRFLAQIFGFKGIEYSSPTLASATSNLIPAFTFVLAIFFRLEKLDLTSSSTQAKIIGTVVSISGALIVVFYKGPSIVTIHSVSNWAMGGLLLAADYLLLSMWFIVQSLMASCFGTLVHTWGVRVKGPVYIALFKPFAIVIAAVTGFIFLGESLYLGSVVGAVVISVGFYVVMWGKAKEEMGEEFGVMNSLESPSTLKAPLLGEER